MVSDKRNCIINIDLMNDIGKFESGEFISGDVLEFLNQLYSNERMSYEFKFSKTELALLVQFANYSTLKYDIISYVFDNIHTIEPANINKEIISEFTEIYKKSVEKIIIDNGKL